jgi:hypothetical protein
MERRELRKIPKNDVGIVVQRAINDGATNITITPDDDQEDTYRLVALFP